MVGNRAVWQSPWVNEVYAVMANTSNEYVTMQGYGVPVSASGQSEKAGSQASSSNDCSSPVVGNLATEEYTVTGSNRGSLSVKTTKVSEKSKCKPVKRPAKPLSEKLEERKEKRRLYMRNYRAQQSKKGKEARLQQMRQHKAEKRISESDQAREARLQQMRQHKAEKRTSESDQAREVRLQQIRQHEAEKRISESDQAREARLQQMRQHKAEKRTSESDQAREVRLQQIRQHEAEKRISESDQAREARLQQMRQHKAEKHTSESDQAREVRLQQIRQHEAEKRISESAQAREARLQQMRQHKAEKRTSESDQAREVRLQQIRQHEAEKRISESDQAREARLQQMRQHKAEKRTSESDQAREVRLQQIRQHEAEKRISESDQAREARLQQMRQHKAEKRTSESDQAREVRLQQIRQHEAEKRISESDQAREVRLQQMQQRNAESRRLSRASITGFIKTINTFCDKICEICTKRCYTHQISNWIVDTKTAPYLPDELTQKNSLVVCNRCKSHLTSKKVVAPSKSYWNNLDPGTIPEVISVLTQAEQRLISRIIPFVKIIKLSGIFGQYSFRGQAVLFAQDVFEVTENLPNMLPRTTKNAGIVVITERLENVNVTRQFFVYREKVYAALRWLVANNPLYKDVTIDQNVVIDNEDIIRVEQAPPEIPEKTSEEPTEETSAYMSISDSSRIVRASWHQGNDAIFTSGFAGVQCCAMALSNILRASILTPQHWSTNTLNLNMIIGDQIYGDVRYQTEIKLIAYPIENDGYLQVRNFNVIKDELFAFGKRFEITIEDDPNIYGNLCDKYNAEDLGRTLCQGLEDLFLSHSAGILITGGQSFGVMYYNDKYYFSNSHSCGPKGSRANESNGKALHYRMR
ncbi:uncharacterized protein LOC123273901 [Cotesia glomerata]|uniref:uncharacterized protein LOC123273901 n=1 Tax=Cotesia glomerata TaxID=32391 RepID=UPI001D00E7B1|nr:uncharacterized protein LOC123273901 [Cotesia glomerata]